MTDDPSSLWSGGGRGSVGRDEGMHSDIRTVLLYVEWGGREREREREYMNDYKFMASVQEMGGVITKTTPTTDVNSLPVC